MLDVGSGPGNFGNYLTSLGCRVISSDIAFEMVRAATRLVPSAPGLVNDMRMLPLRDDCIDAVLCAYSLMHIPSPFELLVFEEFARVLRPSGVLQLMVKTGVGAHAFCAGPVPDTVGHVQLFDPDKLLETLEGSGFTTLDVQTKATLSPHEFDHPKLMILARWDRPRATPNLGRQTRRRRAPGEE